MEYVVNTSAVHIAMLYRAYAQGVGGLKTSTLLERALVRRMANG